MEEVRVVRILRHIDERNQLCRGAVVGHVKRRQGGRIDGRQVDVDLPVVNGDDDLEERGDAGEVEIPDEERIGADIRAVAFSSDGRLLAAASRGGVRVWRLLNRVLARRPLRLLGLPPPEVR